MLPRSLTARLTLLIALGATAVVGICLAALYAALAGQLQSALDSGLVERSQDLQAIVQQTEGGTLARDPLAQLYAADGSLITGSTALHGERLLPAERVRQVTSDLFEDRTVTEAPEARETEVRLYARPIGDGRVLAVAVSAEPVQAARGRMLAVVFVAAPLLVGLFAALGWLVVRAALRPVDLLTHQAGTISSLDTDRRLPTVPGDDEIARLARTLDAMLARLRLAFAREREFVDDASHELRTPIAVLQGELELALSADDVPQEVSESLHAALRETGRLSRLTQDLLQLARDQSGSMLTIREPIDLLDLVRDHARSIAPVLGLDIQVRGDPAVVEGDPERLRQVLSNLAGNSASADATVVDVHVSRGPTFVTVRVADNGPGFPPELLDAVFERFVRGDDARTRGSSGAGLGLSIVRAVVAAHAGQVEARNGPPLGGAVVTIQLPPR